MTIRSHKLILFLALIGLGQPAAMADDGFQVVVSQKNSVTSVSRKFLQDAFLKKIKYWENGSSILPVDLSVDSPTRADFSKQVLKRPVSAVRSYWQQMIFSGRGMQAPELESDAQVMAYIRKNSNAIGYVSPNATIGAGVKTVTLK